MEKALRAWRLGIARQRGVPPYVVLHDKTLLAIVAARPQTTGELLDVPGMGPVKAEQFGAAILALLGAVGPPRGGHRPSGGERAWFTLGAYWAGRRP